MRNSPILSPAPLPPLLCSSQPHGDAALVGAAALGGGLVVEDALHDRVEVVPGALGDLLGLLLGAAVLLVRHDAERLPALAPGVHDGEPVGPHLLVDGDASGRQDALDELLGVAGVGPVAARGPEEVLVGHGAQGVVHVRPRDHHDLVVEAAPRGAPLDHHRDPCRGVQGAGVGGRVVEDFGRLCAEQAPHLPEDEEGLDDEGVVAHPEHKVEHSAAVEDLLPRDLLGAVPPAQELQEVVLHPAEAAGPFAAAVVAPLVAVDRQGGAAATPWPSSSRGAAAVAWPPRGSPGPPCRAEGPRWSRRGPPAAGSGRSACPRCRGWAR